MPCELVPDAVPAELRSDPSEAPDHGATWLILLAVAVLFSGGYDCYGSVSPALTGSAGRS